jgi:uncharacterized cupin superfamily protein
MSTLTATNPYRLAAGEGIAEVWWKTGRLTVKTGVAADASFAQLEVRDPRGTATPLHIHHDQDEAFYVLQGEVVVFVEDDTIHLGPGDLVARFAECGCEIVGPPPSLGDR